MLSLVGNVSASHILNKKFNKSQKFVGASAYQRYLLTSIIINARIFNGRNKWCLSMN